MRVSQVRPMDRTYWDALAPKYQAVVLDAISNDRRGVLRKTLAALATRGGIAGDLGCGIGIALPTLASCFREVYGFDFSASSLKRAQRKCRHLTNVRLVQLDLRNVQGSPVLVDVGLSTNVLISPRPRDRRAALAGSLALIRAGGRIVLVVPSIEAVLYSLAREIEWHERSGMRPGAAAARVDTGHLANIRAVRDGIVVRGAVRTKHYLREELEVFLTQSGVAVETVEKLEYAWSTEFARPPRWMREPYPWDWLAVGRKR